jgi:hypothetical protein
MLFNPSYLGVGECNITVVNGVVIEW